MRISWLLLPVLALILAGCSKKETTTAQSTNDVATGNPLTAPVDYLGAVVKAKKTAEKVIDSTSIHQAVEVFYAQEDRFPKDLQELVAKHYIAAVPPAPAGKKWQYNPQTGEIKPVPLP